MDAIIVISKFNDDKGVLQKYTLSFGKCRRIIQTKGHDLSVFGCTIIEECNPKLRYIFGPRSEVISVQSWLNAKNAFLSETQYGTKINLNLHKLIRHFFQFTSDLHLFVAKSISEFGFPVYLRFLKNVIIFVQKQIRCKQYSREQQL